MDIEVATDSPESRRAQAMRRELEMARLLASSPAWEWFTKVCAQRAAAFERELVDRVKLLDPREEDRLRGEIDAYRRLPRLVEEKAAAHKRAAEKAAKQEQQHAGPADPGHY